MQQQDKLQDVMKTMVDNSPLGMLGKMFEQNMSAWQNTNKIDK
jgi:hypothetical protein